MLLSPFYLGLEGDRVEVWPGKGQTEHLAGVHGSGVLFLLLLGGSPLEVLLDGFVWFFRWGWGRFVGWSLVDIDAAEVQLEEFFVLRERRATSHRLEVLEDGSLHDVERALVEGLRRLDASASGKAGCIEEEFLELIPDAVVVGQSLDLCPYEVGS